MRSFHDIIFYVYSCFSLKCLFHTHGHEFTKELQYSLSHASKDSSIIKLFWSPKTVLVILFFVFPKHFVETYTIQDATLYIYVYLHLNVVLECRDYTLFFFLLPASSIESGTRQAPVVSWTVSFKKKYVVVLTWGTCECDLIWK